MKCCTLCLDMGTSIVPLDDAQLKDYLRKVFRGFGFKMDGRQYVCYECKALLAKGSSFIQKVLRSQKIIRMLAQDKTQIPGLENYPYVSMSTWTSVRVKHNLISSLSFGKLNKDIILKHENPNDEDYVEEEPSHELEIDTKPVITEIDISPNHNTKNDNLGCYGNCEENNIESESKIDNIIKCENNAIYVKTDIEIIDTEAFSDMILTERNDYMPKRLKKKSVLKKEKSLENTHRTRRPRRKPYTEEYIIMSSSDEQDKPNFTEVNPENIIEGRQRKRSKVVYSKLEGPDKPNWKRSKKQDDDEYIPKEESGSESESDLDMYNEYGKKLKRAPREYPRQCDHCNQEIVRGVDHYKHYLVNHTHEEYPYKQDKLFVCQYCGIGKQSQSRLLEHEMTHTDKKLPCTICGKLFFNKPGLLRHRHNVHVEKRYTCDYCNKRFPCKSDLKLHIRIHTGEKPFKCTACDAAFAHKGNLNLHIRNHPAMYKDDSDDTDNSCPPKKKRRMKRIKNIK